MASSDLSTPHTIFSRQLDNVGDGSGYTNGTVEVGSLGNATFDFEGGGVDDEWTLATHGLLVGDHVQFSAVGTGAPEYLVDTDYYVVTVPTAGTFQLSATRGGDPIEGTVDSTGTWTIDRQTTIMSLVPASPTQYWITRMIVMIEDAGSMVAEDYGATGGALTNGIQVRVEDDTGTLIDLTDSLPVKSNALWGAHCYDVDIAAWGQTPGNETALIRWTFEKSGYPLHLHGADTDNPRFEVVLNDDLSGLVSHCFTVQGWTT